jgi:hypothetical protein
MGKEMREMECSNCGAAASVVHGTYDLKQVGLKNVVLQGIEIAKCPKCRNEDPIIPNMNGLMRALAPLRRGRRFDERHRGGRGAI